jgi:hypothetical protein
MTADKLASWIEEHPGYSIGIGLVVTLGVLWLLGFFSSSSSAASSDGGQSNMAAAYYAAEAQQAVVGGQIQISHEQTAAQTAQAATAANAAVAINDAQTRAAITINGQNADTSAQLGAYGLEAQKAGFDLSALLGSYNLDATRAGYDASVTINQQNTDLSALLGNYGLLATRSNNETTVATNAANNSTAYQIAHDNNLSSAMHDFLGLIVPQELALTGGDATYDIPGGPGTYNITGNHYVTPAAPVAPIAPPSMPSIAPPHVLTGYEAALSLGPIGNLFQGHNTPTMDIQQALIKGIPIPASSWAQAGVPRIAGF